MHIRPLKPLDLSMLANHELQISKENGQDGDLIFSPIEGHKLPKEEDLKKDAEALLKSVETPGWSRVWVVTDETEILGELTLVHRPALKTAMHRCLMMMGLQRKIRKQGWGSKLIKEAINWSNQQPHLDWITLNVFENNLPAKALYKKFGFQEVGTTKDMFRLFGNSVDDTQMVLKLK